MVRFKRQISWWLCAASILAGPMLVAQTILVQPYLQHATPTSIVIMWETNVNSETALQYGPTPALELSTTGTSMTTLGSTQLHTIQLSNLLPATRYYYRAKTGSWLSAVYDLVTPPLNNSEQNFNIVLMSDMQKDGSNPNIFNNLINTSLLPYIASQYGTPLNSHLQMAMLPGDIVDAGNNYNQWKNDFFNPGQSLWSYVPSYPAIGNHEVNSANYFNYFNLPLNGTNGYLEHWYTHDYSNVRVLSFDTNPNYRIPAQLAWLDSILNATCNDPNIDFVFAQMHHPYKSELWIPGETDYTGQVVERMENFSQNCGKPTIHFFGHTHAYSRGQSRDHEHLWVNVATSGGNIDYWGEFENADYDEFVISQDEYGFVMVEVTAGANPKFTMRRLSFGDQYNPGGSTETDLVTVHRYGTSPIKPVALYPTRFDTVSSVCVTLKADGFGDANGDEHGSAHWQISVDSINFNNPVHESWKQYANWYNEVNTQANDNLTDELVTNLPTGSTLFWRVRYRDQGLKWSPWSTAQRFNTRSLDTLTGNLVLNPGGESGIGNWTPTIGVIESLNPGECAGISPFAGARYFAVGALCVEHPFASANQLISVSAFANVIDSGNVLVNYGAYMCDWQNTDEPWLALQFLNQGGNVISGTDTIKHKTGTWTLKQNTQTVPIGTRTIRFIIMGKRFAGTDNDSYFDEIHLRLIQGDNSCSSYTAPGPANNRIYVDKDGIGFPDGENWTTAYRTLGDALLQTNNDPDINEIWIANGQYHVTSNSIRDTSFHIIRGVKIYGGFSGHETSLSQRNIQQHITTLTAEIGNLNLPEDNAYHVLRIDNTTDTTRLDGLTICCGYANGENENEGGGIYFSNSNSAPLIIDHCTIENNVAESGSSIYNQRKLMLIESTISDAQVSNLTTHSVINNGINAELTIFNSTISQQCTSCQVISNINGGKVFVMGTGSVEKE